jgi:hypothetical protein
MTARAASQIKYVTVEEFRYGFAMNDRSIMNTPVKGTWVEAFSDASGVAMVGDSLITDWVSLCGSEEALEWFLYEFFFSKRRMMNVSKNVVKFTYVRAPDKIAESVDLYLSSSILRAMQFRKESSGVTGMDYSALVLFDICVTNAIEKLGDWLRVESGYDPFHVIDTLIRFPQAARSVWENDIDESLTESLFGGAL